jgi:hypothetical protein
LGENIGGCWLHATPQEIIETTDMKLVFTIPTSHGATQRAGKDGLGPWIILANSSSTSQDMVLGFAAKPVPEPGFHRETWSQTTSLRRSFLAHQPIVDKRLSSINGIRPQHKFG